MTKDLKILITTTCFCWMICLHCPVWAVANNLHHPMPADTVPPKKNGLFKKMLEYRDSLRYKAYRQSLLKRMAKQNDQVPLHNIDSTIIKSEAYFTAFKGMVIRNIYYRKVKVFGPSNINDTTFTTSMKLIHLANRLHYDSREWVIRQSLFFREDQPLDPFVMADNERYLRNRPFIQDARIYISYRVLDSVDVEVVTKDLFEYGAELSQFSANDIKANVSNNNLFGAGQGLKIGMQWRSDYSPTWNTELRYTKYNVLGTFIDINAGYSTLNNYNPLDSNVYEGAYYISFNRPLYRNAAKLVGGFTLYNSWSINIKGAMPEEGDSLYRDYRYTVSDGWIGYNFINHYRHDGVSVRKPNFALLARLYNLSFQQKPNQERFKNDPVYNNHRYSLLKLQAYNIDYFKTQYFFGFGRTEDIPLGYNISATTGWENWKDRQRFYSGIAAQKFWKTNRNGLFNSTIEFSTFWAGHMAEDAVFHARLEYYSRLLTLKKSRFRQFLVIDYLNNPNPYFYKPLNINMENGIWGFRNTTINGFQRLNMGSETVYYSPLKFFGFKFNFFSSLEASLITNKSDDLLKNTLYLGIGGGVRVRNENLSLNTLKISGYYYPNAPDPVKQLMLEITTIIDFRFDVSALRAPSLLIFR